MRQTQQTKRYNAIRSAKSFLHSFQRNHQQSRNRNPPSSSSQHISFWKLNSQNCLHGNAIMRGHRDQQGILIFHHKQQPKDIPKQEDKNSNHPTIENTQDISSATIQWALDRGMEIS
ncbi:Uncharacterized protein TCM_017475 [Theobroma cacao]|uniref:Uncharacterized protein n=1 Tax=Theobroma cacao TaxID=3641 RepID=A0A061EF74_THECC|nr:Uncharacterized protein TCM_017475 [Theobroma cacao]